MKNILAALFCLLSLTSCIYTRMLHLTEEDMTWMEPYSQGDTILFASGDDVDTMVITEKKIFETRCPFTNEASGTTFYGGASFDFTIKHGNAKMEGFFYIRKEDDDVLTASCHVDNRIYRTFNTKRINFSEKKIAGTKLNDVITVNAHNSKLAENYVRYNIPSFCWSKSKGLIQYQMPDGEVYTLQTGE